MIALKAHFDGKVFVPDEPVGLAPNQRVRITVEAEEPTQPGEQTGAVKATGKRTFGTQKGVVMPVFTPFTDLTTELMNGDAWDESAVLHIDPLDATPKDFVRRPGSAAGKIKMAEDFNETPDDFEEYL